MEKAYTEAKNALLTSQKILAVAHRKPDGDSLGSIIALALALEQLGKKVDLACIDEPSERFGFLPKIGECRQAFTYSDYDLIIICDAGAYYMTGFEKQYPEFLSNRVPILNIDHHLSNEQFGTYNIVDTAAASATIIVHRLLKQCGIEFTPEIATALLTGIYNDTGGFMHSNTTPESLRVAGELMARGAALQEMIRHMFKTTPVAQLRLWGRALCKLHLNSEQALVAVLEPDDFAETNASFDLSSGIVDFITSVPQSRYTVLLSDNGKGHIKGSFRTRRDDVDVARIAEKLGGGGHKKAAGFSIPGTIQKEIVWRVVPAKRDSGRATKRAREQRVSWDPAASVHARPLK